MSTVRCTHCSRLIDTSPLAPGAAFRCSACGQLHTPAVVKRTIGCRCGAAIDVSHVKPGQPFACPKCGRRSPGVRRTTRSAPPCRRPVPWLLWFGVPGGAVVLLVFVVTVLTNRPPAPELPVAQVAIPVRDFGPQVEAIVAHPWWRRPVTREEAAGIVAKVMSLQREHDSGTRGDLDLILWPDGTTQHDVHPLGGGEHAFPDNVTAVMLQGGGERVILVFVPGPRRRSRHLSAAQAGDLVLEAVGRAHASEEKFRRTGEGDAILDQFLQMKVAPQPPPKR
jgi:hypothetical protein